MNEPQVWTLIGVFAASMVGIITLVLRTMNTQFTSLRNEMRSDISAMRTELKSDIASVHTELKSDIASLRTQITHLDRDVQAISKRVFPE